jgi:SAM-dependent methyltransferase
MELKTVFSEIYEKNLWGSKESKSGTGSSLFITSRLRDELVHLLIKYDIKSVLDIPCGDFNWMQYVDFADIEYTGADIVPQLIEENKRTFPGVNFKVLDAVSDDLPEVDLIIARDMLGHLSDQNIYRALQNFKRSKSKYLLVTTFTKDRDCNFDIKDGQWRPFNLMIDPYNLIPIYLINEDCREAYPNYMDKCMILIRLADV